MICTTCGKSQLFGAGSFCSYCGSLLSSGRDTLPPVSEPVIEVRNVVPWESPLCTESPLTAFYTTCFECIMRPRQFYAKLTRDTSAPFMPSLWFGLITGSFGILMSWLWFELFTRYGGDLSRLTGLVGFSESSSSMLMYTPVLIIVQLVVLSLYAKLMMRFTKANRVRTRQVIRVLCYAESTSMLLVIPFVGSVLSLVLWVYSALTGLHILFNKRKTAIALMLLLPCFLLVGIAVLILAAALAGGIVNGLNTINGWGSIFN